MMTSVLRRTKKVRGDTEKVMWKERLRLGDEATSQGMPGAAAAGRPGRGLPPSLQQEAFSRSVSLTQPWFWTSGLQNGRRQKGFSCSMLAAIVIIWVQQPESSYTAYFFCSTSHYSLRLPTTPAVPQAFLYLAALLDQKHHLPCYR